MLSKEIFKKIDNIEPPAEREKLRSTLWLADLINAKGRHDQKERAEFAFKVNCFGGVK